MSVCLYVVYLNQMHFCKIPGGCSWLHTALGSYFANYSSTRCCCVVVGGTRIKIKVYWWWRFDVWSHVQSILWMAGCNKGQRQSADRASENWGQNESTSIFETKETLWEPPPTRGRHWHIFNLPSSLHRLLVGSISARLTFLRLVYQ